MSFQEEFVEVDPAAETKARFLSSFDRTGSVTVSAAELGINRNTAYGWARRAGLRSNRRREGHPRRAEYDQLRAAGTSRRAAAAAVGVHLRTAQDWDKGIRKTSGNRLHPDGRRVDYTRGMITKQPVPSALEVVLHPRFLSLVEREQIADLRAAGASMRGVAIALGRPASTISRELRRNVDPDQPEAGYRPYAAHRQAAARRVRPKLAKLVANPALAKYVQAGLDQRWSPEQICHALVSDHPDDGQMRVSPETIYQALYVQARGGLRREIASALRTGRTRRKLHRDPAARTPRFTAR